MEAESTLGSRTSLSTATKLGTQSSTEKGFEGVYELSVLSPESELPPPTRRTWSARFSRAVAKRHPVLFGRMKSITLYIRGPRPKVDLPAHRPLFDIDLKVAGKKISLPIESSILKATRPLTALWLFVLLAATYIVAFTFFARAQSFLTPPGSYLSCLSTYWRANNKCGLDGRDCGPFDNEPFDFRCPAQCENAILQNPRTVGDQQIAFKPLIVGGGDSNQTYRGDSFVCAAAIQAGFIPTGTGGCASVRLIGNFTDFLPFASHGLTSIGFPSVFPYSFRFSENTSLSHCRDYRNEALVFNILITCSLFLLFRPKPLILFWSLICIGFWHVVLFSQPRGPPPKIDIAFGVFLPTLFIAYTFWRLASRHVLPAFSKAPLESCLLYLSGFWVGILNNLTLDKLPLSRLTSSDITKRNGAVGVLVVGVILVLVCVTNQVRVIRKTGWLPYYLGWYAAGGVIMLVLGLLPGYGLRLHHYIVPMMVIPLTAWPTRLSALYQGLCLGLFLNGIAAFGFDGIVQSLTVLRQDAVSGSGIPEFISSSLNYNASIPWSNQIVRWSELTSGWDGFSLLIDDVERYAGSEWEFPLISLDPTIPHFFRIAYTLQGIAGDFTKAAALWPNGTWIDPAPGSSY